MLAMTTQSLTLTLPEPVLAHLREVASNTQQPLEQIVRQSIEGNLPPSIANAPADMKSELLALQKLSVPELKQMALSQLSPAHQKRHLELLERNSVDALTPEEVEELANLRIAADRLMLRKAYAWALLRWHGQPIPTLAELPIP
jgi:hypothetical protein